MAISRKLAPHIARMIIVLPMTLVMSLVGTLLEVGLTEGWFGLFGKGFLTSLPVAYIAASLVIPLATKITAKISFKD